jgi:hypothetical protein
MRDIGEVGGIQSPRRFAKVSPFVRALVLASVTRAESGTGYAMAPSMNISELDDAGDVRRGWCFVPEGSLVAGDVVLAQKLALESNESQSLAVAKEFVHRPSVMIRYGTFVVWVALRPHARRVLAYLSPPTADVHLRNSRTTPLTS